MSPPQPSIKGEAVGTGKEWGVAGRGRHVPCVFLKQTVDWVLTDTRPKSILDAMHRNDLLLGKQSRRTNPCLAQYQVLQGLATKRSVHKYTQSVFP